MLTKPISWIYERCWNRSACTKGFVTGVETSASPWGKYEPDLGKRQGLSFNTFHIQGDLGQTQPKLGQTRAVD